MARILVIEDDKILSTFIKQYLTSKLVEVDTVFDGADGLHWLQSQSYAAAVVDWELPGKSGVELCKEFRENGGNTPIIMLTKRSKVADKVKGFDVGADDYLAKPFELEELWARLKSLLRRPATIKPNVLSVGSLEIDTMNRTVSVKQTQIELSRKEFCILELLASNPGQLFSGDAILDKIWSTDLESSVWAVRTAIARIRSKIAAIDEAAAQQIKTIYGQGYKLDPS